MPVFEAKVFILDFFHLFDIIGFHTIKFRFPVVVRVHQFTSSPVHQFTSSPVHQFTSSTILIDICCSTFQLQQMSER